MNFELLLQIPIFQKCSRETLKKLSSVITLVQFNDGATVFQEGSLSDSLYIVSKGEVVIFKWIAKRYSGQISPPLESQEKVITTLQKGEFFGEISLLEKVPRSASARAKGDTVLFKIESEPFWRFIKSDPSDALQTILLLTQTISERLRQTTLEFATIYELSKIISSGLNQKELAVEIIREMATLIPTESFIALALWNEFNDEFKWASVSHPEKLSVEIRRTFSRSEPIPKFLEEKMDYFLSENWKEESRFTQKEKDLYGRDGGTLLTIPLLKVQKNPSLSSQIQTAPYSLLGFIFCRDLEKISAFDRQMIHLLITTAHLSSTAIENSNHRETEEARKRHVQQNYPLF